MRRRNTAWTRRERCDLRCGKKELGWAGDVRGEAFYSWRVKDRNWAVVIKYGLVDSWIHGSRLFRDYFREWNPSITGLTLLKCMAGRLKPRFASSCFALAPVIWGISGIRESSSSCTLRDCPRLWVLSLESRNLARCPPRCLKGEMQALVGLSCENLKGSLRNRIANGALRLASKTS